MDDETFILLVQSYKELYDISNPNYHNQLRRDNIWEEIEEKCGLKGMIFLLLIGLLFTRFILHK